MLARFDFYSYGIINQISRASMLHIICSLLTCFSTIILLKLSTGGLWHAQRSPIVKPEASFDPLKGIPPQNRR